jgi:hypothetical protein
MRRIQAARRWLVLCAGALALGAGGAEAASLTLPLTVVLKNGAVGSFGSVRIEELSGGRLGVDIALAPGLGSGANLQQLFFNLSDGVDARRLTLSDASCNDGPCRRGLRLGRRAKLNGDRRARFDLRVDFASGGKRGNGPLGEASFVLDADAPLALADLTAESSLTQSGLRALFAASVRAPGSGSSSTTVGVVPEPMTAAMVLSGLVGLAFAGGTRSRR